MRFLKEGDIINIEKGMRIYAQIPRKFIFINTPRSNKLEETDITVGQVRESGRQKLDTSKFAGKYVVVQTKLTGGGEDTLRRESYPDGHYVVCKRLKGHEPPIAFFQSGTFTATIRPEEIKPIGKAKPVYAMVKQLVGYKE